MARADELGIVARTVQDFAAIPGRGVTAREGANAIAAGNAALMDELGVVVDRAALDELARAGKTPRLFVKNGDLVDVPRAIELSRAVIRNITQDLFWALFYNALGIPLAAGVFYPLLGWQLSPAFGAAAMSLSSLCVVGNALRLRTFQPRHIDQSSQLGAGTD